MHYKRQFAKIAPSCSETWWIAIYEYKICWQPEGRYYYIQRCSIENQKGAIALDFVQR